jgi:hypothetical protein
MMTIIGVLGLVVAYVGLAWLWKVFGDAICPPDCSCRIDTYEKRHADCGPDMPCKRE